MRPTTVWLYVVNGTVEQSVLEVSTRRRLAMMEQHSVSEGGGRSKRSRTSSLKEEGEEKEGEEEGGEEEEEEEVGRAKRQKIPCPDGEGCVQGESPTLRAGSPKRKRKRDGDGDDGGDQPRKHSPRTPISTERQLDLANSQELEKGPGKLIEKSPGGGELVGNEDLWACLFGVSPHGKKMKDAVRRELLAGAAENRVAVVVVG